MLDDQYTPVGSTGNKKGTPWIEESLDEVGHVYRTINEVDERTALICLCVWSVGEEKQLPEHTRGVCEYDSRYTKQCVFGFEDDVTILVPELVNLRVSRTAREDHRPGR